MKLGKWLGLIIFLVVLSLFVTACSRLFGPSDHEIIKAVQESEVFKTGRITLVPPITVVKKGKRLKDGGWPVKVKITFIVSLINGKSQQMVREPDFRLYKSKDAAGNTIWTAKLGAS